MEGGEERGGGGLSQTRTDTQYVLFVVLKSWFGLHLLSFCPG
jgi:hypothetical protein